jgi:hypothetical protein
VADHLAGRVLVRATALLDGGGVVGPVRGVLVLDGDEVRLEVPEGWPDEVVMAAVRPRHDLPVIARVLRPEVVGTSRHAVVEFAEHADRLRVVLWASR